MRKLIALISTGCLLGGSLFGDLPRHPKYGFPVYTNQPAGKQMAGQWAAASTPALSPADEQKSFKLPDGFQARLFAAEPDIANPVAMSFDERGRLWVLELYEYPLGAEPGARGRDRVKILEDTDGDGSVDKVTVFADGFSLATGLLVANGGVYVGEAPNLWFLEDTDGDGVADRKTRVLTGFGMEDRHELLNGFTWGPDGQMYMTHGVFTRTLASNPDQPSNPPTLITAGVARLNPKTRAIEVFAEGTSNPWGVDFDAKGNAFVSACVIDHLFHLAPGGNYQRQAGQPPYPYAYGLLPSIVDHRHHMAAYAGVCVYQGDQWPAEWKGEVLMGNIHQNALNHDHLQVAGSSFKASKQPDFMTTSDGWFMPVSSQIGPDGALWVMDWYDKYPCYQNANADPAGVDRERGRIWRVVWVGNEPNKAVPSHPPGIDFARLPSSELVPLLGHPNIWHRRMAQRVLTGREDVRGQKEALVKAAKTGASPEGRLSAFWSLYGAGLLNEELLDWAAEQRDSGLRIWSARFTGERRLGHELAMQRLQRLAVDPDAGVRAAVATACRQFTSGQLTVNTPLPEGVESRGVSATLADLVQSSKAGEDPTLNFLIWTASEPGIIRHPEQTIEWFRETGSANLPLSGYLIEKTMRRFCDAGQPALLDLALDFLYRLSDDEAPLMVKALDGLLEGLRGKATLPSKPTETAMTKLLHSRVPDVASRAQRLGSLWGDSAAIQALISRINEPGIDDLDRIKAIQAARSSKTDESRLALEQATGGGLPDSVKIEAVRALGEVGNDASADQLLKRWNLFSPALRRATAELLSSKPAWALRLLALVGEGVIKRGDLPPTTIRNLATHKNAQVKAGAEKAFGRVNATSAEKLKLIDAKRKVVLDGPIDLAAGHEVAKKTCFICHKLYGEGAEVGPDLTGVGRSSLDALLHNVINPNEIIGQGYENVEVETKDGRTISGRMTENNDARIRILLAGPQEEVIPKQEVKQLTISPNSVMPEGLEQMPDADFRNLIWYILAPPGDARPLTPERKKELIGGSEGADVRIPDGPLTDGESIALWAPGWQVDSPQFEGAPAKYPSFNGRANVLMTHPYDSKTPAAIVRPYVPALGRKTILSFLVASHVKGDWELRVVVDGETLHKQVVGHNKEPWTAVRIDLSAYAGRRIVLRLENAANDWNYEFGYWADLKILESELAAK